ncbi:Uncharacterised protein [Kingella kingae]|uniref:Uncharacterized protein n=1 Tax=Kingella kingae TaxID=504 RepID=A0AAX2J2B9_KINKI|nr:protein of unknown function [Kingella kingae]SQH24387.1 Uncharacterised protein [Kingella kingae]STR01697.1 Uncharacterised protein [Kingella kingae]
MTEIYQKLKPIIDECYQVFKHYPVPKPPLNICTECCASLDIAKDLVSQSLRK